MLSCFIRCGHLFVLTGAVMVAIQLGDGLLERSSGFGRKRSSSMCNLATRLR